LRGLLALKVLTNDSGLAARAGEGGVGVGKGAHFAK
jgi:hypothetical protein